MTEPTPPAEPAAPPAEPAPAEPPKDPAADAMSSDAGKKALAELRQQNKALAEQLKELQQRDPLKDLLSKLGQPAEPGADPVAALTDRVTKAEERAAKAELAELRRDVADEKGLTKVQAAELVGATREQLEAHADRLLAAFPTAAKSGTPAPDPSQGARGGSNALEAQLKAAQEKGDVKEAIRLKTQIAAQKSR